MNVIILMAGPREAFQKAGYAYPKALIEIQGEPVIHHVVQSLAPLLQRATKIFFVINREDNASFHLGQVLKLAVSGCNVIESPGLTKGGACSALLAIDHIDLADGLVITNGDQIIDVDVDQAVASFEKKNRDGGILVFNGIHPRWSFAKLGPDGFVVEVAEKRPISRYATAGFYYFARGSDFVRGAKQMIRKNDHLDGSYFVCPVYNQLILEGAKIAVHEIERSQYHSLASPTLLEAFEANLLTRRTSSWTAR